MVEVHTHDLKEDSSTPLVLAHAQADGDGLFRVEFDIPEQVRKGAVEPVVTVRQSSSTSVEHADLFVR